MSGGGHVGKEEVLFHYQKHIAKEPFYLHGGGQIYSLGELLDALQNIDDNNFRYHVNEQKNDFASWIRHCMKNHAFATKISKIESRPDMIKALEEEITRQGNNKTDNTHYQEQQELYNKKKEGDNIMANSEGELPDINKLIAELEEETENLNNDKKEGLKPHVPDAPKTDRPGSQSQSKKPEEEKKGGLFSKIFSKKDKKEELNEPPSLSSDDVDDFDYSGTNNLDVPIAPTADEKKEDEEKPVEHGLDIPEPVAPKKDEEEKDQFKIPEPEEIKKDNDKKESSESRKDVKEKDSLIPEPMMGIPKAADALDIGIPQDLPTPDNNLASIPSEEPKEGMEEEKQKEEKRGLFKKLFSKKEKEDETTTSPDSFDDLNSDIPLPEELLGDEKEEEDMKMELEVPNLPSIDEKDTTSMDIPPPKEFLKKDETTEKPLSDTLGEISQSHSQTLELPELPPFGDEISPKEVASDQKPVVAPKKDASDIVSVKPKTPIKKTTGKQADAKGTKKTAKKAVKKKSASDKKKPKETPSQDIRDLISIEKKKVDLDMQKQRDNENNRIKLQIKEKEKDISTKVLEMTEKIRNLEKYEKELNKREEALIRDKSLHERSSENLSNLKRKHDGEVRERTKYLRDAEKDLKTKSADVDKKLKEITTLQLELEYKEKFVIDKEKQLENKESSLKDRENKIEIKEDEIKKRAKELDKKDTELSLREKKVVIKEDELSEKKSALSKSKKEIEERKEELDKKEETLNQLKERLEQKENELNVADKALDMAMDRYTNDKDSLEDEEFHEYLQKKLSEISSHKEIIRKASSIVGADVPRYQESSDKLRPMIDECRRKINDQDFEEAKRLYNQIRLEFQSTKISDSQKESLHNTIRKLYDDINIGLLDR